MFNFVINRLEESLLAIFLAAMTLITFAQVVVRYANSHFWTSPFGVFLLENLTWLKPLASIHMVWSLELTTYLFAWLVLLGMSYGVRVGAHIGVDAITRLLPPRGQRVCAFLAMVLCLAYCVLLLIGAIKYVHLIYQLGIRAESLPIYQWVPYIILPIGLALLLFRFAQVIFNLLQGAPVHILADEAQEAIKEHLEQKKTSSPNAETLS